MNEGGRDSRKCSRDRFVPSASEKVREHDPENPEQGEDEEGKEDRPEDIVALNPLTWRSHRIHGGARTDRRGNRRAASWEKVPQT